MTPPNTKNNLRQSVRRKVISLRLGIWMRPRRRWIISFGGATSFKVPARCASIVSKFFLWVKSVLRFVMLFLYMPLPCEGGKRAVV